MANTIKIFFSSLVMLSLILTGCTEAEQTTTGNEKTPFVGGDDALELEFLEGSPPFEVFDSGEFPFDVTLKILNKGEFDVPPDHITITLTGIDPNDFGLDELPIWTNDDEMIYGVRKDSEGNVIPGHNIYTDFTDVFNFGEQVSGNVEFTLRANICYDYQSEALSKLCFLEDVMNIEDNPLCDASGTKTAWNAGSPIHVTSIEQSAMGNNKISFSFKIKHVGSGMISKKDSECDNSYINKDKIYVNVTTGIENKVLTCNGLSNAGNGKADGEISLSGQERTIMCIQDIGGLGEFEKLVKITAAYDYKHHTSTDILVKHILT